MKNLMSTWIWLSNEHFPERQRCRENTYTGPEPEGQRLTVAQFAKSYDLQKPVATVELRVSGDTAFCLQLNGRVLWNGPTPMASDWLKLPAFPPYYFDEYTWNADGADHLDFLATVRLSPIRCSEQSRCHGGFFLEAEVHFQDGTVRMLSTDGSWQCRVLPAFDDPCQVDLTQAPSPWEPAVVVDDIWHAIPSPIPVCTQESILPTDQQVIVVPPGQTLETTIFFDKVYAAYPCFQADAPCVIECQGFELEPTNPSYNLHLVMEAGDAFRDTALASIGGMRLKVVNTSSQELHLAPSLVASCYPITQEGHFSCSDDALNAVYEVCKWTTRICRQQLHLDSPKHQEPLACTGDYYIESLMTAFTYGDMRLAAFDILRTAQVLELQDGRIFHTTYSLIWVIWLWEVYQLTGNKSLLKQCRAALGLLLRRFQSYLGENGLVENPPDYMFVDWLVVDGFSMHHPPKYLGQGVMNAFYHGALRAAVKIYTELDGPDSADAQQARHQAECLRSAFNALLYDPEKKLYFDGLGTPAEANADQSLAPENFNAQQFTPRNECRRHFSRHTNALAVLYGIVPEADATPLLRRTLDSDLAEVQPYFMHFVLEAIWQQGLFDEYGMRILSLWKPLASECPKGLKEGWFPPEPTYQFDYSHAWGGTPAYQLPARLLGLEMLEPGFRKIALRPRLYGLDWADIRIPTPYGELRVQMQKDQPPQISLPHGLAATISHGTPDTREAIVSAT